MIPILFTFALTTYYLPLTTYHLPLTTYHLPLTTYLFYKTEIPQLHALFTLSEVSEHCIQLVRMKAGGDFDEALENDVPFQILSCK
jgi:hypothetical protein